MRFMIIVRATPDTEAGIFPEDDALMAAMVSCHEELARSGVLLDAAGLQPSAMEAARPWARAAARWALP